jgi:hypothetical protein
LYAAPGAKRESAVWVVFQAASVAPKPVTGSAFGDAATVGVTVGVTLGVTVGVTVGVAVDGVDELPPVTDPSMPMIASVPNRAARTATRSDLTPEDRASQ